MSEYCPGIIDREGRFYECPEGHLEKLKELAGDMVSDIPKDVSPLFYLTDKLGCVIVDYDDQVRSGVLTAANAGHEYPILKTPGGSFEIVKDKHGFVLGGMARMKYKEYELRLEPGSKLFVYTDGVAEAMNVGHELFGMDRTVAALNAAMDESPEGILRSVDKAVADFVGEAEQFDDLTMLCIEYRGRDAAEGTENEGING